MGRGRCLPELEDEKSFYRARWVPFLDGQDQVRFRQLVAAMPGVALAFTKMWSLMEFLNPGWLGSRESYRRRFLLPIQQQQEKRTMEQLKLLTGPFILRRTKTDKAIIADLPEKFETKVFCYLTREQASLYKAVTDEMLELIDQEDPMSRRGLVLATLTKLKQICNHPALFLQDGSRIQGRSGKLIRFTEILEEMLASDQRALVFTQYARMGHMLKTYLEDVFNQEVLFLHGQVPKGKRDAMIQRFQQDPEAPGIFILSLRAGGTGLNLTRASHVFHYDRWWNPAVENQATDRAFCIGQTRNVQMHKLLCVGTLEERIDALIEGEADPCSADSGGRGTGLDGTFHRGIAGTYPVAGKNSHWGGCVASRSKGYGASVVEAVAQSGIVAQSRRGSFGNNWWARRWEQAFTSYVADSRLSRGKSNARSGKVQSLQIERGKVSAKVQGTRRTPYQCVLEMAAFSREEAEAVVEVLREAPTVVADLLSGSFRRI